jgi:hypothetical protein
MVTYVTNHQSVDWNLQSESNDTLTMVYTTHNYWVSGSHLQKL